MQNKVRGIVNSEDPNIKIHNEGIAAAKKAAQEFVDKHGEPMYCGFAWVNIKPGTSRFARSLKAANLVDTTSYYGGYDIWDPAGFNTQSMDIKEVGAEAYANVLESYGIQAQMMSRAD